MFVFMVVLFFVGFALFDVFVVHVFVCELVYCVCFSVFVCLCDYGRLCSCMFHCFMSVRVLCLCQRF